MGNYRNDPQPLYQTFFLLKLKDEQQQTVGTVVVLLTKPYLKKRRKLENLCFFLLSVNWWLEKLI
jgi:hypothetical protein